MLTPRHIATYSRDNYKKLKFLIPIAVAVLFILLGLWIHGKILDGSDKGARLYTTALKPSDGEQFNYSIDTRQGAILMWGEFKATTPVQFEEMNRGFIAVVREKQEYSARVETYPCGDSTCTRTVYEWQSWWNAEKRETPEITLFERNYPAQSFMFSLRDIKAKDIITGIDTDEWYPNGKPGFWGADLGTIRYVYRVVDPSVYGTIMVDSSEGTLKSYSGDKKITVDNMSVDEKVKRELAGANVGKWFFIVIWAILTIAAVIATIEALYSVFYY